MKFAVHQPNFCPWVGFFAKWNAVDVFVIGDDMQMPGPGNYVSRCMIAGPEGQAGRWLSVPNRSRSTDRIDEVQLVQPDQEWKSKHLSLIKERYRKSPHFSEIYPVLEHCYGSNCETLLAFNLGLLNAFKDMLKINVPAVFMSKLNIPVEKRRRPTQSNKVSVDERTLAIAECLGANEYVSGIGGNNYQDPHRFVGAGVALSVVDVRTVEGAIPNVGLSTIDHLMRVGPASVAEFIGRCQPEPFG